MLAKSLTHYSRLCILAYLPMERRREDLKQLLMEIGARRASLTDPSMATRIRAQDEVRALLDMISRRYGQIETEEAVRLFELQGMLEHATRD